jgi:biopolymer transport protein ExbB/TolQ
MTLLEHFRAGGWAMWPILFWLGAVAYGFCWKTLYLFSAYQEVNVFTATITKLVEAGDWSRAIRLAAAAKTPLGRITRGGLARASRGIKAFEAGMDEVALYELPLIHRGVRYLALYANLAMLSGLFGTILGLIKSFGSVGAESVDYTQKSRILAEGISEAMNCTAFGLFTAIVSIIGLAILGTWSQNVEDSIHAETVKLSNAVLRRWNQDNEEDASLQISGGWTREPAVVEPVAVEPAVVEPTIRAEPTKVVKPVAVEPVAVAPAAVAPTIRTEPAKVVKPITVEPVAVTSVIRAEPTLVGPAKVKVGPATAKLKANKPPRADNIAGRTEAAESIAQAADSIAQAAASISTAAETLAVEADAKKPEPTKRK